MTKSVLYIAIGLVATSSIACAEDLSTARAPLPPGAFTTSGHSDEWKIENALSAGPASITDHATVVDWPLNLKDGHTHGRVLRQGSNGWTCMPDIPGRPQHDPMCADETMMKWMAATLAGEKPNIDRVGLAYMLMGEARQGQNAAPAKDPTQVKEWFYIGPHVMVVLPDSAKEALRGINQDLSNNEPYVTLINSAAGSTPLWVIPVAKSGATEVMSELEVHIIQSFDPPGGMGEAWTSPIVPAVTNGNFAATGKRLRKLPVGTIALKQLVNEAGTKNLF